MTTTHPLPGLFALSEIRGPVLRPGDPADAEAVTGFNLSSTLGPDVVVGARGADDVVTAMRWASATGTPVAVQATGHGATFRMDHGLLISTARMTDVHVDPDARTAEVAAGAKWSHVLAAGAPYGLAGLSGSSTDVGAVGHTLGGGLPVLGRAYGFAADHVRSFRVATPDGTLREADAEHEPDLFRALRGGKGNAGVVTSMVCGLLPLPRLYGGSLICRGEDAEPLLRAWLDWTRTVPDEMCSAYTILRLPPVPQIPEPMRGFWARVALAWPGTAEQGEALTGPLRTAVPLAMDLVGDIAHTEIDRVHLEPQDPLPDAERCLLLEDLTPQAVSVLMEQVGPAAGPGLPLLLVELRHMGAALSRPPAVPDSVGGRDARYLLYSIGLLDSAPAAEAVERANRALFTAMAPYGTGRTLVNLHGAPGDLDDRTRAWTPSAFEHLRRVKSAYDPSDLLRFGHTV